MAAFYAEYDRHPGDRLRLFGALSTVLDASTRVLYPGSYVDVAASAWFDDVTYLDLDRRAARFFAERDAVADLMAELRGAVGRSAAAPGAGEAPSAIVSFLHRDYRESLPVEDGSAGLLVSLYAGFVSEHCTEALAVGGTLLVNPSHGDAALASTDPRYELTGTIHSHDGDYRVHTDDLDTYLVPKRPGPITRDAVLRSGRAVAYTRPCFAYLFTRVS